MTKSLGLTFVMFASALCLTVQLAQAQKGSGGGGSPASAGGAGPTSGNATSSSGMRDTYPPSTTEKPPETILMNNAQLSSKLQPLLPAGITPQEAAKGYHEIADFVTAVHASHDLGISFADFKCAELGGKYCTPGTQAKPVKIEGAILALKPGTGKDDAKHAVKTAKQESKADLQGVNVY